MTRVCLDLFSGLGGFPAAFAEADDWEVVTVDIEERFDPDIRADVMDLRPADLPEADVVLCGHPCDVFSKAANWNGHWNDRNEPQTLKAREHLAMLFHTLGLIRALAPDYWFLENPNGKMSSILGEPTGRVTYCQYGTDYQKPTDLWGRHPPMEYRKCDPGDPCHRSTPSRQKEGDGHIARSQPDTPEERARVPYDLSLAIREAVEDAYANPPPEQATLALEVPR